MNMSNPFGAGGEQDGSSDASSEQLTDSTEQVLTSEELEDTDLSERELRKRIRQANKEFETADGKLDAFREKVRKLRIKGSEAERSDKRKTLALFIRQVKQRAAVMKLKQQTALRDLFKYTLQKEIQSIQEMLREELNRESPMEHLDIDSDEFTKEFDEVAASVQAQTEEMTEMLQQVSNSVEGASTDLALDIFPEEEEMDRIAEAEADAADDEMELDVELEDSDHRQSSVTSDGSEMKLDLGEAAGGSAAADTDEDDDDDLARSLAR
jgi:chromosome segregation ATPase